MNKLNLVQAVEQMHETAALLNPANFVLALLSSLIASLAASALYHFFYENRGTGSQVNRSFPLLGISITTLFVCVQVSLPLSLGLLGALSIIRFRTPIKEPEEVGFIMLVIAASVACATFQFVFLVLLFLVAVLALVLIRGRRVWAASRRDGILVVAMADVEAQRCGAALRDFVARSAGTSTLESSSSRDGSTSLQFSVTGLKMDAVDLQKGIRDLARVTSLNVFLDRPGGLR